MAQVSKISAVAKLADLAAKAADLLLVKGGATSDPEFQKWQRAAQVGIAKIFGEESKQAVEFKEISFTPLMYSVRNADEALARAYMRGLQSARVLLESLVSEVEEYGFDGAEDAPAEARPAPSTSKNIFIVHGRDEKLKETVARLVTKLGYNPVILHERPNGGRTVIEKFEANADACFAIALLTPDDVGSLKEDAPSATLKPRARQNVILEFGYFLGRLSRKRVCAITAGEIEIPSDYAGVVYIPLDAAGAWQFLLIREMKEAGLSVDANAAV